jgi:hypothetical protein
MTLNMKYDELVKKVEELLEWKIQKQTETGQQQQEQDQSAITPVT